MFSVVVPIHNESEGIKNFLDKELFPELEKIKKYRHEVIFVDDGSTDNSLEIIQEYAKKQKNIRIIALSRNFGKEPALSAGLAEASGDAS